MKTMMITILLLGYLLMSCSPLMYSTIGQNVPMFKKKGEVSFAGGKGEGSEPIAGIALQAGYAVSDKVEIISSFYNLTSTSNPDWSGHGNYVEFGIGKYATALNSTISYDVIGGIGFGKVNNKNDKEYINNRFIKPFIQPSVGLTTRVVDLLFTPRIGLVSFTSTSSSPTFTQDVSSFLAKNKTTPVFEPGLTLRIGFQNFKFQAQSNWHQSNMKEVTNINSWFGSIGCFILISDRWDKSN